MAEVVNIASLRIDTTEVIKESAKLKKEIDSLKKTQKELDVSTTEGAEAFAASEIQIKNLSKSYRDNQQFAAALESANEDLTKTIQTEGKSTQELYDSRSQLQKIAKNLKGDTEDEAELREKLNTAIDAQTEALRGQSAEYIQGKDRIGEYTDGINRSDLSIQSLIKNSKEAGGANELFAKSAKSAVAGLLNMTKAALAFILTPVGAALAIIAGAFLLIKNAMNRSEESTNKLKKAFAAFEGILQFVLKALEPLGKFLIDYIVWYLDKVQKAVFAVGDAFAWLLDKLGFDDAAEGIRDFKKEIEETVKVSQELADAEAKLTQARREARLVQLEYQKDAEKLRQFRDDETNSIADRIKANEELGQVLKRQLNDELSLAQTALEVANKRIELEGETEEALNAKYEALTEIADIEERITGQESEQLMNRMQLEKEAIELRETQKQQEIEREKEQTEKLKEEHLQRLADIKEKHDAELDLLRQKQEKEKEIRDIAAEIEAQDEAEIQEALALDAQNKFELKMMQYENEYQAQLAQLERDKQAELRYAEAIGADTTLINDKYAKYQKQIQEQLDADRLSSSKELFDNVTQLLGENTAAGKLAGMASATINTYQGITEVWKAPSVLPEPFNTASKIAASATTLASGLSAVRKISGVNAKFADGDILQGRSHAQGGIPFLLNGVPGFEAEGGEAIINKRSTSMFAPLLSAINVAGGGKKFAAGSILGSATSINTSAIIDYDLLATNIAQANQSLNLSVSVSEINEVNSNVSVIENLANLG